MSSANQPSDSPSTVTGKEVPGIIEWEHMDKRRYYIGGVALNLATTLALYPTKVIKIRLQADSNRLYRGAVDAAVRTIKNEGPAALYNGIGPNLFGVVATQVYITCYEFSKSVLKSYLPSEPARNLVAGIVGSCSSQVLRVPADVISQRLMVHGRPVTDGAVRTSPPKPTAASEIRLILSSEGIRGFFRGYGVSLLTQAPASGIFWMAYGGIRRWQVSHANQAQYPPTLLEAIGGQAVASMISGGVAAVITNPLDVVKTNVQLQDHRKATGIQPPTARGVALQLFQKHGLRWFGRGMSARITYMSFNAVILTVAYETVKHFSLL